ncbi:EpsG family protein [Faecalicoccus pleomorphus]|uniref:EpsG family protein n=1 Tax=Faecalicoccus pleomorphus TaxID=1323 RepID=UPI0022E10B9E|nr:EpsG family protein [Faecalicoccus pleomorphus]
MIIYIIVLLLLSIYSLYPYIKHNSIQSRKIFLFLSFTTFAFVLGFRGENVGEDTSHYLDVFRYAVNVKWSDILCAPGMRTAYYTNQYGYTDTIESGFLVIAKIVHWFTNNGQVFLFLIAVITCILFAKFIYDNCKKVVFPTFIFLCESMFMLAFNGARQILAVAIVIQAYTYLKNKKWKKAIVVTLLAAMIHNVALVSFVLFPIMMIKPKNESKSFKYAILLAITAPFIIVLGQTVITNFFPRYISYFSINYWENSLGGTALLWITEFIFILIAYWKKFKIEESFSISSLVLIYLACELMGLRISVFSRVGWFFRPYLIIFFPIMEQYFSIRSRKYLRVVVGILLILLFLSYARTPARIYYFFGGDVG